MAGIVSRMAAAIAAAVVVAGCGGRMQQSGPPPPSPAPPAESPTSGAETSTRQNLGVGSADLSPVVDNPYVAFSSLRRTVHEGPEGDVVVRVESTIREQPATVAGVEVLVVEVSEFEDGELVEKTEDYYAQDRRSGDVYYMGERVDDYEGGRVVGHGGQWLAGENGALAGVFMPGAPRVGAAFEQERAPGVAEDRSRVVATGLSVTVPAGSYTGCIETEDVDPIGGATEHKTYCPGAGLVREDYGAAGSIELIELETR